MEAKTINKAQCDNTYRLIIIGANGVGKTSLVTTFIGKDLKNQRHYNKSNHTNELISEDETQRNFSSSNLYEANICLSFGSGNSDFRIVHFEAQIIDDLDEVVLNADNDCSKLKITPIMVDGCLCVFDISRKYSFDACTKLRENILRFKVNFCSILDNMLYFIIKIFDLFRAFKFYYFVIF